MNNAERIDVAISDTFFQAMQNVPPTNQKPVHEFIIKFRNNPRSPGINYEKIRNAREPNYRSVRITRDYRGIVLQPDKGNVYILLWVDKHDDAYAWAERTQCNIHPRTGALQIYETRVIEEDPAAIEAAEEEATESYEYPLPALLNIAHDDYLEIGVPENMISVVQELNTMDELQAIQPQLPVEAFEALVFLAEGESIGEIIKIYGKKDEQIVDTSDYEAALEHPATQRRFHLYTEDEELLRMLNQPLEQWRVYLHQEQRKYAEWDVNGPIRVLGGAGTGKTVVAMHRANWLVTKHLKENDKPVLFTTFTANLALDIKANLRTICSPQALERIEVTNINAWVGRFVRSQGFDRTIVYDSDDNPQYAAAWKAARTEIPEHVLPDMPESFYREEWHQVVLPQNIRDLAGYVRARRTGRGVGLNRRLRAAIWPVFETLRAELARRNSAPFEDAVHAAIEYLEQEESEPKYSAVIVDEAQDFGLEVMKLIRKIVPERDNDIFIVGDAHQRIYGRRAPLSHAGIQIVGRARRLRLNYRTSEEIRSFATRLLEGIEWDDLDTATDETDNYRSLFHSAEPHLQGFDSMDEEVTWILAQIDTLRAPGEGAMDLSDICVVARTNALVKRYADAFEHAGISIHMISRAHADDRKKNALRVATIHRVKGLGFRAVFVAGVSQGVIPLEAAYTSEDPVERENAEMSERALLHVGCTRAMHHLFVTWNGPKSPFLEGAQAAE